MQKICILFIVFYLLLIPVFTRAATITEIMYDLTGSDDGREWIEIFNDRSTNIDLTKWKLLENEVGHKITSVTDTDTVSVNTYAVIADDAEKFLIDNPDYTGLLFESAFSFSNSGEEIGLIDTSGNTVDTKTYINDLGAKGDGLSLQLLDDVFIAAEPTPGEQNAVEPFIQKTEDPSTSLGTGSTQRGVNVSAHSAQIELSLKEAMREKVISISAGRERSVAVDVPIHFEGTFNQQGIKKRIKFLWNFGDGKTAKGRKIAHEYKRAGTYNVVLNAISGSNRAVSRTKVYVFDQNISLKKHKEGVFLENRGQQELNIGDFKLKQARNSFIFPKDTIVSPNNRVLFDWELLDFDQKATKTIDLYLPSGRHATSTN